MLVDSVFGQLLCCRCCGSTYVCVRSVQSLTRLCWRCRVECSATRAAGECRVEIIIRVDLVVEAMRWIRKYNPQQIRCMELCW